MTDSRHKSLRALRSLAALHGVQRLFIDNTRQRRAATDESLEGVLRALGAPLTSIDDAGPALREERLAQHREGLPPVAVAWDGRPPELALELPVGEMTGRAGCRIEFEDRTSREWNIDLAAQSRTGAVEVERITFVSTPLRLPHLPHGYHHLVVEHRGRELRTLIVSAPGRAYGADDEMRSWGVFLPLYALRTQRGWGMGDFTDLGTLMDWVSSLGGDVVATLPVLASQVTDSGISPYAPVSRMFWNELYVDLAAAPNLAACDEARETLASDATRSEIERLRDAPLVDYADQATLRARIIGALAQHAASKEAIRARIDAFVAARPRVEDYARFRAAARTAEGPWPVWSEPARSGVLGPDDFDDELRWHHLYAQWLAEEQLQRLSRDASDKGQELYLDLPLGVHPDGYDVWRERLLFATGTSVGAPPDAFFTKGQNWGFPPLRPQAMRRDGYRYVIEYLRHHMRHASLLRIDHVMGLHRLYWVPDGMEATDGAYVRYAADELYAILSLESHRHRTRIVGENLGTVPAYVKRAMSQRGIQRMYVGQFQVSPDPERALAPVIRDSVASMNTHDMPPFAAFWQERDIADRVEAGLLDEVEAADERQRRRALKEALRAFLARGELPPRQDGDAHDILKGCLAYLARSRARLVLVTLEDLWLETEPQNVPGTVEEFPNWRRPARYPFESFREMPDVVEILSAVDAARRSGAGSRSRGRNSGRAGKAKRGRIAGDES